MKINDDVKLIDFKYIFVEKWSVFLNRYIYKKKNWNCLEFIEFFIMENVLLEEIVKYL